MRALWRATIWHRDAIPLHEQKYASLKRVWLPLYDFVAVLAGVAAIVWGSRLLDRLYGSFTDPIGGFFTLVALVCLAGVAFPRLWAVELAGKFVLVGMICAYIAAIIVSPSPEQLLAQEAPSWFVVAMLGLNLWLPFWRIENLTTEWADRRADERRSRKAVARD
jgi:hypothetical protein